MHLAAGTRLGPYEIRSPIGAGGMGEVYKAHDPRLGRFIAIKILLAEKLSDPDRRRRFAQEARAASALNHPGIVTIYDVGCARDIDYIAMEFVEGKTLQELIPRSGLSLNDFLTYSTQVADAISKAHSAGILHRDLKPGNVIVTTERQVKVLDFGLAKLIQASVPAGQEATASSVIVTDEHSISGTAAYMSPEQAEGKVLDSRSDIFSFGAMLYEMATGQRAFQGDTAMSTLGCVMRDEPKPISEIRPETPPELDRLIRRCLRKDPARRIQTMSDLKVALEELKEESDSGKLRSASLGPRRRPGLLWAGLTVIVGLLVALATTFLLPRDAGKSTSFHPVPLTSYEGDEREPDFSPDGSQVAFAWNGEKQDNWDIYLKVVGSSALPLRLTTDSATDRKPKWSPDGKSIAFVQSKTGEDRVMLTSALGGGARPLAVFPTAIDAGLSWSPDSKWLAASTGDRKGPTTLRLISVETGELRVLTTPIAGSGGDFDPAFSPGGRSLAFVRERGMNVEELWVLSLTKTYEPRGQPKRILGDGKKNRSPAWSANGREIIFSGGELSRASMYRIAADGSAPPVRIDALGDGVTEPALSSAAHRLAFSRTFRNASIWRLEMESRNTRPEQLIAASSSRDAFPQYSPDGKKIAFFSNRTGLSQIWTCNGDGTQPVQLTSMTGTTTGTPRWSPDGQWISFDSNSGGYWQIYVVGASGGQPKALTSGDRINVGAGWSRDGKWIYFTSKRSGSEEVWKIPAPSAAASNMEPQTGTPVQVTRHGGTSSVESPDGKTLYFTKTTPGFEFSLWKMPLNGGAETEVLKSLHRYNFAVTERGIFYTTPSERDSPAEVKRLDLTTGKVTTLYTLAKRVDLGLAVSPDYRYLLFVQLDYIGSDLMSVENFR
jgi:eukaryotic-like serine/threonine-protein kinase